MGYAGGNKALGWSWVMQVVTKRWDGHGLCRWRQSVGMGMGYAGGDKALGWSWVMQEVTKRWDGHGLCRWRQSVGMGMGGGGTTNHGHSPLEPFSPLHPPFLSLPTTCQPNPQKPPISGPSADFTVLRTSR